MSECRDRRSFLGAALWSTSVATLIAGSRKGFCAGTESKPLFRISLAEWSLNRRIRGLEQPAIDHLDFAATARRLGIDAVEYVNQFFMDKAEDKRYLSEMKQRAEEANVKNLLIMIDNEGDLGDDDPGQRTKAVENHYKWVHAARFLDCHSIRVNARSNPRLSPDEQRRLAVDGLRRLTEFGAEHDVNVIVENHGGLSSNGRWLASVIKEVDHRRCGTLPDFGNFAIDRGRGIWYDRYLGVKQLMPYAKAVSAKSHAFDPQRPYITYDERSGKETDYLKMMAIVVDAGYHGWVGIESEGPMDQIAGIKQTRQLLERVRDKLA